LEFWRQKGTTNRAPSIERIGRRAFKRLLRQGDGEFGIFFVAGQSAACVAGGQIHVVSASPDAGAELQKQVQDVLDRYPEVFDESLLQGVPPSRGVEHEIHIVPGKEPRKASPYRLSFAETEELKKQLTQLIES
jgi:hypothetical protein